MSKLSELIAQMKTVDYREKQQFLEYLLRVAERNPKAFSSDDKAELIAFAYEEVENMRRDIPACATYKEKDTIFTCEDMVMGLIIQLDGTPDKLPQEKMMKLQPLVELVANERYVETTVDNVFSQASITDIDVTRLLYWAQQTNDEYQKSKLFQGLLHYRHYTHKMTSDARQKLSAYIATEIRRLMTVDSEDARNALELLADLCLSFPDEDVLSALTELLTLGHNHINYYAVATLCNLGRDIPQATIDTLARDLVYADLTYKALQQAKRTNLFPEECASEEYLAKSDLVHWLTYPTELGKAPDEIIHIGKVKKLFSSEVFHIFKFRSDSETLEGGKQNKWLLGWSSNEGGTFSEFEEFAPFDNMPVEKALKLIKKKIVG